MGKLSYIQHVPSGTEFAPGCFDDQIGKEIMLLVGDHQTHAKIQSADVSADRSFAVIALDVPDVMMPPLSVLFDDVSISEPQDRTFGDFDFSKIDRSPVPESTELVADFTGMSEDQSIRAAAIQAAASTHAVSAYGGSAPDKDVIRTAVRYAYWIRTGEQMPDA